MDTDFWLDCWQQGRTGFHQSRVLPLLQKHWPALGLPAGSRVLVPLCGKSLDMHWLAAQGHRVLGLELSPLAVQQFFDEADLQPQRHRSRYGEHHVAGPIEIISGDAFDADTALLSDVAGVYDRAALIALPDALRQRYVDTVYAALPAACDGLLLTLEYDPVQMDGPPFPVAEDEVRSRLQGWSPVLLERRELLSQEPRFRERGLSALDTAVYRLRKSAS
ncbi:thiopurine S-methyltransferase [Pseudoxanthomonas kalamensis DSM 18571]|uniref:thiopurine S-methyltransferase n=1 Tax=Pseudoxanthomonas kalamensis TaxID=289483 RepID=UPI0013916110|nr:thiopurine S-methyltransferase [Pseudoxanthomonas kalamensis]KAF1708542.1 thiopurine S-methyltransferase [Pseudoxanthomonas kalamensis DSM 18571]